jgi:hypothetical protein
MQNDWDPELIRAFAHAREPLAADAFLASLLPKIDRARRIRLGRQILALLAVLGVVALNLPLVLTQTAAAIRFVGDASPTAADFLISPWGWAASMLIGVWLLLRTRPSRRYTRPSRRYTRPSRR